MLRKGLSQVLSFHRPLRLSGAASDGTMLSLGSRCPRSAESWTQLPATASRIAHNTFISTMTLADARDKGLLQLSCEARVAQMAAVQRKM